MRIGLFGGSFDPIHNGHLAVVDGVLRSGRVDAVIIIPSVRNSFKRGRVLSAAPYRYYMTCEVVKNCFARQNVFVSDIEFGIKGISYSVSTISALIDGGLERLLVRNGIKPAKAALQHELFWICGSDILPTFDQWYKPEELITKAPLFVAKRPGDDTDIDYETERISRIFGFKARIESFDLKGVLASSGDIRFSGDYDKVPDRAQKFISENNLYPDNNPLDYVSDDVAERFYQISADLYYYLGERRLLHTVNTGLCACELAHIHGADEGKALIAGLLHDCAKELPIDEQRTMAFERTSDLFVDNKLLHSPAGAVMAEKFFDIHDEEILDAITYHTTGRRGMTLQDKIIYLADKIEPARDYADLTAIRKLSKEDLDEAVRMNLLRTQAKFSSASRPMHPLTADFMVDMGI